MDIRLVKGKDIDRSKWNSCVHFAHNGNIFGYQWYLTNVVKEWDALVEGNYESVLPLIYREKSFFKSARLYTHPLLRSTGLYSVHVLSEKRVAAFIKAIPKEYKNWTLDLNEGVKIPKAYSSLASRTLENAVLYLGDEYEKISQAYTPALTQALERANLMKLYSINNLKPETLADFYKKHDPANYKATYFHTYLRIMHNAMHRGWGILIGVRDAAGELLAVSFYTMSHHRMMRVISVESEAGRTAGALPFLVDQTIRFNAGKQLFLDFNTQQIGSFEKQFGVIASPYFELSNS